MSEPEAAEKTARQKSEGERTSVLTTSTFESETSAIQQAASSFARYWRVYLILFVLWLFGSLLILVRPSYAPDAYSRELLHQNGNQAAFDFEYLDENEIKKKETMAEAAVDPVYVLNENENAEHGRGANVQALEANRRSLPADAPNELTQNAMWNQLKKYVESASLDGIVEAEDKKKFEGMGVSVYRIHSEDDDIDTLAQERHLMGEFKSREEARESVVGKMSELFKLSDEQIQMLRKELCTLDVFQATLVFDERRYKDLVEKAKENARASVKKQRIEKGTELFTRKSLRLSDAELNQYFSQLRMVKSGLHWPQEYREILPIVLLAVFVGCYGICVFITRNRVASQMRTLCLAASVQTLYFLLFYVLSQLSMRSFDYENLGLLLCFLPLAVPTAIIANLLGARQAVLSALFVSLSVPLFINLGMYEYQLVHFALITSAVTVCTFIKASNRSDFLKAAVWLGAFVMVSSVFFSMEQFKDDWLVHFEWWKLLGRSFANGFGVSSLVYVMLMLFEKLFSLVTPTTLLETNEGRNPLLMRLNAYAPGTFQHCLNVAVIAQEAAQAIAANAELARVMALFHDIGKLNNPQFFAENVKPGQQNPHDTISPLESAAIIRQHVTAGMPLAVKYHVPKPVRPVIEQHHGNSLIGNFYYKAKAQAEATGQPAPDESLFRYPSERPSGKEIVIVSLADSCEAAVKSLFNKKPDARSLMEECIAIIRAQSDNGVKDDKTLVEICAQAFKEKHPEQPHEAIRPMIDMIFDARWRDGQLAEAELTLRELQQVRESFYKTFADMYHFRPQYNTSKQESAK